MRRKFTERRRVAVYLDEDEWKWVELQASGNVSEWCRERILTERQEVSKTVSVTKADKVEIPTPEVSSELCAVPYCGHKKVFHAKNCCRVGDCRCSGFVRKIGG